MQGQLAIRFDPLMDACLLVRGPACVAKKPSTRTHGAHTNSPDYP
jgi:hypothetical protein